MAESNEQIASAQVADQAEDTVATKVAVNEADIAVEDRILPLVDGAAVTVVIGVIGAKGGVGTTTLGLGLARHLAKAGRRVGYLDADIASPDAYFRLAEGRRFGMEGDNLLPLEPEANLQLMSFGGFMETPDEPMLWDSRLMAATALEFWGSALWRDRELVIVDLPTGGGDLPGQLLHRLPFKAVYLISTPDAQTLKRAEQVRNYLDWNKVHCGGLLINVGLGRPEDGSPEVAATRMGLPLLDAVASFGTDAGTEDHWVAPLWQEAVETLIKSAAEDEKA